MDKCSSLTFDHTYSNSKLSAGLTRSYNLCRLFHCVRIDNTLTMGQICTNHSQLPVYYLQNQGDGFEEMYKISTRQYTVLSNMHGHIQSATDVTMSTHAM